MPEPVGDGGVDLDAIETLEEAPPQPSAEWVRASVAEKVALARQTTDARALLALAYEGSDDVQLALLENPALGDRVAAIMARRASQRVAAELCRKRKVFARPLVRAALLECPHAPSTALVEIVSGVSQTGELLKILRSPKIRFLEVKAKARLRLSTVFRAQGTGEKLAHVRRLGAHLLKELWQDFFRDEQLVLACINQAQVDSSVILEIARSRIASRAALEAIGNSKAWTANYPVCLELVLNPKTPRPVIARLLPRLNPSDRQMVKNNASLSDAVRRLAQ